MDACGHATLALGGDNLEAFKCECRKPGGNLIMKNTHRKTHLVLWLLLLPALVLVLYIGMDARQYNRPAIESSVDAERGGLLP